MCNLSKGVMEKSWAKGMEEGRAEGRTEGMAKGLTKGTMSAIKGLMETMNWSIEQAMAAMKVPEAERQNYRELLKQQ